MDLESKKQILLQLLFVAIFVLLHGHASCNLKSIQSLKDTYLSTFYISTTNRGIWLSFCHFKKKILNLVNEKALLTVWN